MPVWIYQEVSGNIITGLVGKTTLREKILEGIKKLELNFILLYN